MKLSGSSLLFSAALGALAAMMALIPPGAAGWLTLLQEPSPLVSKLTFLAGVYLWPATLSFLGIALFQLQFRLAASGANPRTVFSVSLFSSGAMLLGLRALAAHPTSAPGYVLGMALAHTVLSRLYAVRMRTVGGKLKLPWPVWRGDEAGMARVQESMQSRGVSR